MRTSRALNRFLVTMLCVVSIVWILLPLALAILWSLVDPSEPWSYPDLFPKKLSFGRWTKLWETTTLPAAIVNSYYLAPVTGLVCLALATPTAYAFGRLDFPGKSVAQVLSLLPIVLPSFVIAIFFSAVLLRLNIFDRFLSILIGHTVLFMPYAIRVLTVSFSNIPQDLIDAARDMNAGVFRRYRTIYLPIMMPGYAAAFVIIAVLSIEEFALAFVLGAPDFTTIPTILYSYLGQNFVRPNAAVVSLILVLPNVVVLLFLERLLRSVQVGAGTKG